VLAWKYCGKIKKGMSYTEQLYAIISLHSFPISVQNPCPTSTAEMPITCPGYWVTFEADVKQISFPVLTYVGLEKIRVRFRWKRPSNIKWVEKSG